MSKALLYNLAGKTKLGKIKVGLVRAGASFRDILPQEFAHPLGYLAGLEGYLPAETEPETSFHDEMIVMCGFSSRQMNTFLDYLKTARAGVALKAVLTESNAQWSSLTLHEELQKEHDALNGVRTEDAAKSSAHINYDTNKE